MSDEKTDEKKTLEFEYYVSHNFLLNLFNRVEGLEFLVRDKSNDSTHNYDIYPPRRASWPQQMSSYLWSDPPAYRASVPLQKIRWKPNDRQVFVTIEEVDAKTRLTEWSESFDSGWAKSLDWVVLRPFTFIIRLLLALLQVFFSFFRPLLLLFRPLKLFQEYPSSLFVIGVLGLSYLLHEMGWFS